MTLRARADVRTARGAPRARGDARGGGNERRPAGLIEASGSFKDAVQAHIDTRTDRTDGTGAMKALEAPSARATRMDLSCIVIYGGGEAV